MKIAFKNADIEKRFNAKLESDKNEDDEGVKIYSIRLTEFERVERTYNFTVEAESEEDARDIAYDTYTDYDATYVDGEYTDTDIDISYVRHADE